MSVVNEFDCRQIKIQEPTKTLFLLGINSENLTFLYDIACKPDIDLINMGLYFNIKQSKCLIVQRFHYGMNFGNVWKSACMKFWIEKDCPVLAVKYLYNQDKVIDLIKEQFKDQYASMIIDAAINS